MRCEASFCYRGNAEGVFEVTLTILEIFDMNNVNGDNTTSREKIIVRTSVIGIIANVFLAAFKAVIGLMSSSIAIIMDAVNNISDAGSSLITIIGTKLAGREPDKKHPFG